QTHKHTTQTHIYSGARPGDLAFFRPTHTEIGLRLCLCLCFLCLCVHTNTKNTNDPSLPVDLEKFSRPGFFFVCGVRFSRRAGSTTPLGMPSSRTPQRCPRCALSVTACDGRVRAAVFGLDARLAKVRSPPASFDPPFPYFDSCSPTAAKFGPPVGVRCAPRPGLSNEPGLARGPVRCGHLTLPDA